MTGRAAPRAFRCLDSRRPGGYSRCVVVFLHVLTGLRLPGNTVFFFFFLSEPGNTDDDESVCDFFVSMYESVCDGMEPGARPVAAFRRKSPNLFSRKRPNTATLICVGGLSYP